MLNQFRYLKRISNNEYSAACPECGGEPHQNGELPDRFRIWLKSKTTGEPLGWCRRCGHIWIPNKKTYYDPAMRQKWIEEREQYERAAKAKAEHALALLQTEKAWVRYHEQLSGELRQFYYKRGLIDYFIDYWQLGYEPAFAYWYKDQEYRSPTLTIPLIEPGGKVINIKHRLLEPASRGDKYRPEKAGLKASLYYTDYDEPVKGAALLVEGEFKAMTTYIILDSSKIKVLGLPGKTPGEDLLEPLADCEPVYICLDPDAVIPDRNGKSALRRMVEHFGSRARVIQLPYKIDDMIVRKELDRNALLALLLYSRKFKGERK